MSKSLREQRRSNVRRANVTACARCRARKQRCDQKLPACSNCEHGGVECVSTDSEGRTVPRSYIKNLEDRVAYLENQLFAYGVHDSGDMPIDFASLPGHDEPTHVSSIFGGSGTHDWLDTVSSSKAVASNVSGDPTSRMAIDCVPAESFSTAVGKYGGLSLLQSMLADPIARVLKKGSDLQSHVLLHDLPFETTTTIPPKSATDHLISTYFEHSDFFSPILSSADDFRDAIAPLYQSPSEEASSSFACIRFRAFVVFGTAVLLLNRRDSSIPTSRSDGYLAAAIKMIQHHPESIFTGDLEHLVNLLLLIQHLSFASNLTATWHLLGIATRIAIELNLHKPTSTRLGSRNGGDLVNQARWVFWTMYMFERNLCVIIGRPFSIPDEAIETPLPEVSSNNLSRQLARHLVKGRQLESEIYVTLSQGQPCNGAVLDPMEWRRSIKLRIEEWFATQPALETDTQLAPKDILTVPMRNSLVLLYYPSALFPTPTPDDLTELAEHATKSVEAYRNTFRTGKLRFYWRTAHNLFRSGMALAFCKYTQALQPHSLMFLGDLMEPLNSCSSILWGMVERYPRGQHYRDIFESVMAFVAKIPDTSHDDVFASEPQWTEFPLSLFTDVELDLDDAVSRAPQGHA